MKHISEILPNIMTDIEAQYILNFKGKMCSRCPNETTGKRHGALCLECLQASKLRRSKLVLARNMEKVDCECIICGLEITYSRYAVKLAKCPPCKKAHIKQKGANTFAANRSYKSKADPMGELLADKGLSFDNYDIPSTSKFLVRV